MRRRKPLSVTLVVLVGLVATACGASESDQTRSIIVLTADEAPELIVPAGAFLNVVETTVAPPTTTTPPPLVPTPLATTSSVPTPLEAPTTTKPTKDTIPLEEEDPREAFQSTRQAFDDCLSAEGFNFLGPPGGDSDDDDPVNQAGYIEAIQRCNAESGIADVVEEFRASREERSPEQVRENNEQLLAVVTCLRDKGWEIDDPMPDETGALSPRSLFRDAAEEINRTDIGQCASAANLFGDGGFGGGPPPGAGQGGGSGG
ncbi:MAG: hypothetical protein QF896_04275 [Acidimicrobiales bacterium]|nr:hypothetical protein [Acidimicrobiales bacterium]